MSLSWAHMSFCCFVVCMLIWCMRIILWDYESVWPDVWPKRNVGHYDLYFNVHWFCLISWKLCDVWTYYFGIMSRYDPTFDRKIKCRSLWPIFHGPLILPYILKTIWCINIILWDYESVWPDVWPRNKCRSLWPIFHCPVILPFILKTVWCINIIIRDYESVWPNIWPQNKCLSLWPIFNDPVILPYILKTIWCINIILWDYLMDECHICRWDSMTQTLTSK